MTTATEFRIVTPDSLDAVPDGLLPTSHDQHVYPIDTPTQIGAVLDCSTKDRVDLRLITVNPSSGAVTTDKTLTALEGVPRGDIQSWAAVAVPGINAVIVKLFSTRRPLDAYVDATGDIDSLRAVYPVLSDMIGWHQRGTRYGIGVDAADGLLKAGVAGVQVTWMDAKVGDWVVTPRRGKAVEINALWYNALRLLAEWSRDENAERAEHLTRLAEKVRASFNQRFWFDEGGYLYDVVDSEGGTDDATCRPNQVLAISLDHPVLDRSRWQPVMQHRLWLFLWPS